MEFYAQSQRHLQSLLVKVHNDDFWLNHSPLQNENAPFCSDCAHSEYPSVLSEVPQLLIALYQHLLSFLCEGFRVPTLDLLSIHTILHMEMSVTPTD